MNNIIPFRESADIEMLRAEKERLERQLAELMGENLPPFRNSLSTDEGAKIGCRKCGVYYRDSNKSFSGPSVAYERAYIPSWLGRFFGRKPHPARMRRTCNHCKAVYYEAPSDRREQK